MKDEYIIINKTAIQKRIEELEKGNESMWWKERDSLKQILSQSTPLIPEIEKAFDAGEKYITFIVEDWDDSGEGDQININKKDYISNLKLDI